MRTELQVQPLDHCAIRAARLLRMQSEVALCVLSHVPLPLTAPPPPPPRHPSLAPVTPPCSCHPSLALSPLPRPCPPSLAPVTPPWPCHPSLAMSPLPRPCHPSLALSPLPGPVPPPSPLPPATMSVSRGTNHNQRAL